MALGQGAETNCIRVSDCVQQTRSEFDEIPRHPRIDGVAGLVIGGESNFNRPRRMGCAQLQLLQIEVWLQKHIDGGFAVIIITDARDQDSTIPQAGAEQGKVCKGAT